MRLSVSFDEETSYRIERLSEAFFMTNRQIVLDLVSKKLGEIYDETFPPIPVKREVEEVKVDL